MKRPPPPTAEQLAAATRAAAAVLNRPVEDVTVHVAGTRGAPQHVTDDEIRAAIAEHGSIRAAAKALGYRSDGALRNRGFSAPATGNRKK